VLQPEQVTSVAQAGGRIIVSPNTQASVIAATAAAGLISAPGYFTPSEAFAALAAGAHALKLFPAEAASPAVVKAQRAVLPKDVPLIVVGGIPLRDGSLLRAGRMASAWRCRLQPAKAPPRSPHRPKPSPPRWPPERNEHPRRPSSAWQDAQDQTCLLSDA
jgi:2-keto-3-deoxy-6-phosphogluconate aldolase